MLISKETTLQVFDNIPTINGLGLEPLIALRDVKEIIKAVPEVDAVPLDKLCEWLADYMFSNDCAKDDMLETPDFWREEITKWMEEQNA